MLQFEQEVANLIINALNLEGIDPEAPPFREGLDSPAAVSLNPRARCGVMAERQKPTMVS